MTNRIDTQKSLNRSTAAVTALAVATQFNSEAETKQDQLSPSIRGHLQEIIGLLEAVSENRISCGLDKISSQIHIVLDQLDDPSTTTSKKHIQLSEICISALRDLAFECVTVEGHNLGNESKWQGRRTP